MKLEISHGNLAVPTPVVILLLPVLTAVYVLAMHSAFHETREDRVCVASQPEQPENRKSDEATLPSKAFKFSHHAGCSADPEFTSREECPECFRPAVANNFSPPEFAAVPDFAYLVPRGPHGFFQPRETRQQEVVCDALITPRDVCVDACPYLMVLALSLAHEKHARDEIRKTWASVSKTRHWPGGNGGTPLNARVHVAFVLAWTNNGHSDARNDRDVLREKEMTSRLKTLQEEAEVHGDLLMLDMVDTYSNLTLKVASALEWAVIHCRRTRFFLKIDQDTFLNVPLLLDLLISHEGLLKTSVMGHIYTQERYADRTGRWGVDKTMYPVTEYPIYAAGCAYVLSRDAAARVLALFPFFPALPVEDAHLTGLLGRAAGVQHFSPAHSASFAEFFYRLDDDWCGFLTDHLVTGTNVDSRSRRLNLWASYISNDWRCRETDMADTSATCWEEFDNNDKKRWRH